MLRICYVNGTNVTNVIGLQNTVRYRFQFEMLIYITDSMFVIRSIIKLLLTLEAWCLDVTRTVFSR